MFVEGTIVGVVVGMLVDGTAVGGIVVGD